MAALKDAHKVFVVQRLACFDKPSDVVTALKDDFGVESKFEQVSYYDPTRTTGGEPTAKWSNLFWETREAFLEKMEGITIAHKAVRVRRLERIADSAKDLSNGIMEMDALEQAAKEMGGAYTNKKLLEHTGKDGKDLPILGLEVVNPMNSESDNEDE